MRDLTSEENRLLDGLGDMVEDFFELDPAHPCDYEEFAFHIHALQNILLARPATEFVNSEEEDNGEEDGE